MAASEVPTIDMRGLLVAAGLGVVGGNNPWSIYLGSEPNSPDDVVTLYDTGGDPPNPKFLLDEPRFQVRVRGNSYKAAYDRATAIKDALLGLPSQDINGTRYEGIYVVLDVGFLRADTEGRSIFVTSYRIIREPNQVAGQSRVPL